MARIPIAVHFSCLMLAGLVMLAVASWFRLTQTQLPTTHVWLASALTAVLFLITLLAHELAHAWMAHRQGVPPRSITLFALGGVAHIDKEPGSARADFLIAVVGPIASVAIGVAALVSARSIGWSLEGGATVSGAVLGWVGLTNIGLAVFNAIPAYPLDGGRILRAMLWAAVNDVDRATRAAARSGQVIAVLLILLGLFGFFSGAGFGALWLALVAWFLLLGSQAAYAEASVSRRLRGVRVADTMANDCTFVDGRTSLRSIVNDVLVRPGRQCLVVETDGRVLGLLTPDDIRVVDRGRWPEVVARDVMRPIDALPSVTPDTELLEALATMARSDVTELPAMTDGQLRGLVSRGHVVRWLLISGHERAAVFRRGSS